MAEVWHAGFGMPVKRLAQAAAVFCAKSRYFDELIACKDKQALMHLFPPTTAGSRLMAEATPFNRIVDSTGKEMLLLNAMLPVWFTTTTSFTIMMGRLPYLT